MPNKPQKQKEKEKQDALKALRQELAEEITQQLPREIREDHTRPKTTAPSVPDVHGETEAKRVIEAILFTAYMLGMLEIRRLRTLAEDELGAEFDLRAFHDRVVGFGSITLPMLHVSILAWIEEQRADSADQ